MRAHRAAAAALGVAVWLCQASAEYIQDADRPVRGLEGAVEIVRDRWGVNHIYAGTEHDLFFAQGYAAARDRLFQFELWRRQATGTLAEILGRRAIERDAGARLLAFRGDLDAELAWYHPRGARIITAFVAGINAAVTEANRDPDRLPIEFRALGIRPGHWTPAVVISRHGGLVSNLTQEIALAQAVRALGPQGVKDVSYFQPADPLLDVDPAIDLGALTDDIIERYRAARAPVDFVPADVVPEYRRPEAAGAERTLPKPWAALVPPGPEVLGSNNWVIAGRLTQSGKPILANDPHRVVGVPSLRYLVHLVGPGWNVIGGGEPILPGVSIGHNEAGAWGLTIFGNDSEDLYVYETNPADPRQYRYRGAWEAMRIVRDTIAVKGGAPVAVELAYTRHGPVLFEDRARRRAYALRAAWLDVGAAPYLASLRMGQARTWEEFRETCTFNLLPAENMVWAGVDGRIGWQAAGVQPRRPNWSGLVPVPGDGRFEWNGLLPIVELPHLVDPADGFIVTANHYLFPEGYPHRDAVHYTWADAYRAARITEVLAQRRFQTVADSVLLQIDELSIPARRIVPLLRPLAIDDPRVAAARAGLLEWDHVLRRDSIEAGVYAMFQRRLLVNVRDRLVPTEARPHLAVPMSRVVDWLHAPAARGDTDPLAVRDELLRRSLAEAVEELTRRFGADMAKWQWGQPDYHHAFFRHPLSDAVRASLAARLDVGPAPRGGDAYTANVTSASDRQTSGATFRIVADLADWDRSVASNAPGQSGDPDSPHYRDLFERWAHDQHFPLVYSRRAVEAAAISRTRLTPDAR